MITKTENNLDLDALQAEAEKLLGLLKNRQPGIIVWDEALDERLTNLSKIANRHVRAAISVDGNLVVADISDKACGEFGFKHGERIELSIGPSKDYGVVFGVAPATHPCEEKGKVLWLAIDGDEGRVSYIFKEDTKSVKRL